MGSRLIDLSWLRWRPSAPRNPNAIYHIRSQGLQQFRFEWHPTSRRVYIIRVGATPEIGDPIAFEVETHGAAINATLLWCRGYHTCRREEAVTRLHREARGGHQL